MPFKAAWAIGLKAEDWVVGVEDLLGDGEVGEVEVEGAVAAVCA